MPTREEIREGVAKHFRPHTLGDVEDDLSGVVACTGTMELWRYQAEELLEWLHENDVVIKVDSAEPIIFFDKEITVDSRQLAEIVDKVRDTYERAGYVAAEPLIEENNGENSTRTERR